MSKLCSLCKHLGCNGNGEFKCEITNEVLEHENCGCEENFEEYIEGEE